MYLMYFRCVSVMVIRSLPHPAGVLPRAP
ncbi:hypothetical protein NITLEN_60134 [Nitrospira lenta]|uniref:Uncharacterized protein n=1 Tax=Nitrospira lenta TaxID=1436998 RepID=A0A330LGS3_9BACT|nr:hypothetical protein NITLEN_60134 [Nitrospira lenta]